MPSLGDHNYVQHKFRLHISTKAISSAPPLRFCINIHSWNRK